MVTRKVIGGQMLLWNVKHIISWRVEPVKVSGQGVPGNSQDRTSVKLQHPANLIVIKLVIQLIAFRTGNLHQTWAHS